MSARVLLIDNFDSFTYNLVAIFRALGASVQTVRNDDPMLKKLDQSAFEALVISPGPGSVLNPGDLGYGAQAYQFFRGKIPILGICFGHQLIGQLEGGTVELVNPKHGRRDTIALDLQATLFRGLPKEIEGMRYHSWALTSLPPDFKSTAQTADGVVMGIEHADAKIYGLQFHPESVGTPVGEAMVKNFLAALK